MRWLIAMVLCDMPVPAKDDTAYFSAAGGRRQFSELKQ
jgi:hypothetical protein